MIIQPKHYTILNIGKFLYKLIIYLLLIVVIAFIFLKPSYIQNAKFYILNKLVLTPIAITINDLSLIKKEDIVKLLDIDEKKNIYNINIQKKRNLLLENFQWIKHAKISRFLPNNLNIEIVEYQPVALWEDKDKLFYIGQNNNIIFIIDHNYKKEDQLIIFSGENAYKYTNQILNIIQEDISIFKLISRIEFVHNRRWDIYIKHIKIKLPEHNILIAWKNFIEFFNQNNLLIKDIITINMSIIGKIFIEYKPESKYLKHLKN